MTTNIKLISLFTGRHALAAALAVVGALALAPSAGAFGSSNSAWKAYYNAPGDESTWEAFCNAGGGRDVAHGDGVMACGPTGATSIEIPGGISTPGFQCVELSERFLYVSHGWTTIGANGAQVAEDYAAAHGVPLIANGTAGVAPHVGDVMSFSKISNFSDTGHTGVVIASSVDSSGNGTITLLSENIGFPEGTGNSSVVKVSGWHVANLFGEFPYTEWVQSGRGSSQSSITGLSPSAAPIGVQVTISGTDLSGATQVAFNGAAASITSDTATQITTYVPNGATTGNISVTTPTGTATSPFTVVPGGTLLGNITGNGKADLIAVNETSAWVMLSTGTSFAAPVDWHEGTFYGSRATLACDVNGDRKTDLVAVNDNSAWVMLSTGSGFSAPRLWSTGTFYGSRVTLCADVNGDRKADLVAVNDTSAWVMRSTGSSFAAPVDWHEGTFYGSRATLACDVNSDGKADLVAVNDTSAWVMRSTGSSFAAPADWHEGTFYGSITTLCADVNGDRKADLIAVNDTSAWVMRSTGSSFAAPADWHDGTFYGSRATVVGDVNGDGKADLVAVNETSAWVMRSTGSSFSAPADWHEGIFFGS